MKCILEVIQNKKEKNTISFMWVNPALTKKLVQLETNVSIIYLLENYMVKKDKINLQLKLLFFKFLNNKEKYL